MNDIYELADKISTKLWNDVLLKNGYSRIDINQAILRILLQEKESEQEK